MQNTLSMFSNIVDKDFVVNLVRLACESVEAVGATLYTVDPTRRFLKPFVIHKLPQSYIDGIGTVEVGKQCCGRAVAEKKPWVVQDMLSDPLFRDGAKGALNSQIRAAFSVPVITAKGDAVGSLACHFREPRLPTASEISRNEAFATLIAHGLEHPTAEEDGWRALFDAVLRETDPEALPTRIEFARRAIYDRLEVSTSGGVPAYEEGLAEALRILREIEQNAGKFPP